MRNHGVVEGDEHLADIAATHEQTGAVVDPADAGKRLDRPEEIGLRAGRAIDLQRVERKLARDVLFRFGPYVDLFGDHVDLQHDVERCGGPHVDDGFE